MKSLGKKIILVAHNCNFDSSQLITLIKSLNFLDSFKEITHGFVDTLSLFKTKFPKRNSCKLENLAKNLLNISVTNAHNATYDVDVLEKLTTTYISFDDIDKNKFTVEDVLAKLKICEFEKKNIAFLCSHIVCYVKTTYQNS